MASRFTQGLSLTSQKNGDVFVPFRPVSTETERLKKRKVNGTVIRKATAVGGARYFAVLYK